MATQTEIATADELEEKKDAVSLDAPPKEPALVADPRYLQMNPAFPGLAQLHTAPPLYRVRGFLSPDECDRLINSAKDHMTPAPVVGAGNGQVSTSRTSSTCYLAREDLPSLVSRVCALTGKPLEHLELPQARARSRAIARARAAGRGRRGRRAARRRGRARVRARALSGGG